MALAVTTVAAGGLPIIDVTGAKPLLGLPVTEAAKGIPVTKMAAGKAGLAVTFVVPAVGAP